MNHPYRVRTANNNETPCDEETALILLEDNPGSSIRRQGQLQWVPGSAFLEFGELAFDDRSLAAPQGPRDLLAMGVTVTTETFPPFAIASRLGIVAAEHVARVGGWSEFLIGLADGQTGRSATAQKEFSKARESVLSDLRKQAAGMGGSAIIGLHLTHTTIEGQGTLMFLVAGYGTAVTFAAE